MPKLLKLETCDKVNVRCFKLIKKKNIYHFFFFLGKTGKFYTCKVYIQFSSVQSFSCVRLCKTMDCSMSGLPVHHQLPEFTLTHVHWVGDAIPQTHPLSSPSRTLNLSQHQGLFKWVSSSHQVAKILEFQLQRQSFQWIFRTDLL